MDIIVEDMIRYLEIKPDGIKITFYDAEGYGSNNMILIKNPNEYTYPKSKRLFNKLKEAFE